MNQPLPWCRVLVLSAVAAFALLGAAPGCSHKVHLMPTPNIYVRPPGSQESAQYPPDVFDDVPAALRTTDADVLYVTDRKRNDKEDGGIGYGTKRSRSLAFGECKIALGPTGKKKDEPAMTWDALVQASRTRERKPALPVEIASMTELGRFPATPPPVVSPTDPTVKPQWQAEQDAAANILRGEIARRLATSKTKEVFIYVHGVANSFDDSALVGGMFWHFIGRRGVPIVYSWPAGGGGLLRGYTYDRESSEFTVYHLKQFIRLLASCPEVERINLIAHSRGTDVLTSALRELHIEQRGAVAGAKAALAAIGGRAAAAKEDATTLPAAVTAAVPNTMAAFKFGTLILAAPDIDMEVFTQRLVSDRIGQAVERIVIYVRAKDKAIGTANWLFGGSMRAGALTSDFFTPQEVDFIRQATKLQIVDVKVKDAGPFGHSYFYANPAVSADVVLVLRDRAQPGANTRPLGVGKNGFWFIDDTYFARGAPTGIASTPPAPAAQPGE